MAICNIITKQRDIKKKLKHYMYGFTLTYLETKFIVHKETI